MNLFLVSMLVLAVIVVSVTLFLALPQNIEEPTSYQGPVPEGYEVEYFRKTGITKEVS